MAVLQPQSGQLERTGSLRSMGSFDESTISIESTISASKQIRSRVTELSQVSSLDLSCAALIQVDLEGLKPLLTRLAKSKITDVKIRAGGEDHRLRDSQTALTTMCEKASQSILLNFGSDKIPSKLELDTKGIIRELDKEFESLRKAVMSSSANERQSLFRQNVTCEKERGCWHAALMALVFFGAPSLSAITHRIEASCLTHGDRNISQAIITPNTLLNIFSDLALGRCLIDALVSTSDQKESLTVSFLMETLVAEAKRLLEETSCVSEVDEVVIASKPKPPWNKVKAQTNPSVEVSSNGTSSSALPSTRPPLEESTQTTKAAETAPPPPPPTDNPWTKCESRSHKGKFYWFNTVTGKSQWKPPKEYKEPKSPKSPKAAKPTDKEETQAAPIATTSTTGGGISKSSENKPVASNTGVRAFTPQRRVTEGDSPKATSAAPIDNTTKRKKQVGLSGKGVVLGSMQRRTTTGSFPASPMIVSRTASGESEPPSPKVPSSSTGPMIARFSSRPAGEGSEGGKKRSVSPMIARRLAAWKSSSSSNNDEGEKEKTSKTGGTSSQAKKFPSSGFASSVGKRSNSAPVRKTEVASDTAPIASYVESLQSGSAESREKTVPTRKLSASLRSSSPVADRVNMWKKKAAVSTPTTGASAGPNNSTTAPVTTTSDVEEKKVDVPKAERAPSPAPRREPTPTRTRKVSRVPASSSSGQIAEPSDDVSTTVKHTVRKPSPSRAQKAPNFGFNEPTPSSSSSSSSSSSTSSPSIGAGSSFSPKGTFSMSSVPPAPAPRNVKSEVSDKKQEEPNGEEAPDRGRNGAPKRKTSASLRSASPMAERLALWKAKTESSNSSKGPINRSSSAGVFGRRGTDSANNTPNSNVDSPVVDRVKQWKRMASSDSTDETKDSEISSPSNGASDPQDVTVESPKAERESTPTRARGREPSPIADRLRKWKAAGTAVGVPSYLAQRSTQSNSSSSSSSTTTSPSYVASLKSKSVGVRAGSAPPRSPGNKSVDKLSEKNSPVSSPAPPLISETNPREHQEPSPKSEEVTPINGTLNGSTSEGTKRLGRQGFPATSSTASPSTSAPKRSNQRSMSPLIAARMKAWQTKAHDNASP